VVKGREGRFIWIQSSWEKQVKKGIQCPPSSSLGYWHELPDYITKVCGRGQEASTANQFWGNCGLVDNYLRIGQAMFCHNKKVIAEGVEEGRFDSYHEDFYWLVCHSWNPRWLQERLRRKKLKRQKQTPESDKIELGQCLVPSFKSTWWSHHSISGGGEIRGQMSSFLLTTSWQ
jgi:hypothetical protein